MKWVEDATTGQVIETSASLSSENGRGRVMPLHLTPEQKKRIKAVVSTGA
jgi:hypothetical protein